MREGGRQAGAWAAHPSPVSVPSALLAHLVLSCEDAEELLPSYPPTVCRFLQPHLGLASHQKGPKGVLNLRQGTHPSSLSSLLLPHSPPCSQGPSVLPVPQMAHCPCRLGLSHPHLCCSTPGPSHSSCGLSLNHFTFPQHLPGCLPCSGSAIPSVSCHPTLLLEAHVTGTVTRVTGWLICLSSLSPMLPQTVSSGRAEAVSALSVLRP